ncbi:MAG: hypothetical protein J6M65_05030 [Eubacterium sp.]|nr:hypothetical protein [Eubacterium sp.]
MAEEYVLIDDIIKNHTERMMSLRKYYPFFMIMDGSLAQFRGGEYKDLDMGYLVLAILRFFINENSFNDKPVSYKEYETFVRGILRTAFNLEGDLDELIRYIFDKIRNSGRAFEMPFFDPVEKEMKIARVRFIDSIVKEEDVVYTITEEGIEFYLSTKEVKDESTITTEQLLLEKLIRSENFRGSIDVIERINIEVSQLEKRRREVMKLLLTDVHAGSKAVDEYMERTSLWFAEERKSFAKNRELVDKAVKKASYSGGSDTIRDVNRLSNMLKQTIENHSMLIASTAELSRFSDEMIRRNRTRSLKNAFDFEGLLRRLIETDRPELMACVTMPFMQIKREKSFPVTIIDNVVTSASDDGLKGEKKEELRADLSYRYEDELLSEEIGRNFAKLFKELLIRLTRWKKVTLEEYLAILEVKFGNDIYKNRDLYAFLVHISEKNRYDVKEMLSEQETFLEEMVVRYMGEEIYEYTDLSFSVEYEKEEIEVRFEDSDVSELTALTFVS